MQYTATETDDTKTSTGTTIINTSSFWKSKWIIVNMKRNKLCHYPSRIHQFMKRFYHQQKKVIKFRPFLVKKKKFYSQRWKTEVRRVDSAIKIILKNCVQGNIDVKKLPLFDIEYLFLKLRSRSMKMSEIGLNCAVQNVVESNQISINMDEIEVNKPEGHTRKIMISDEVGVMMSYPVKDKWYY